MASITVVSGESIGDYYPLAKRTMVIGRDEALPIQVKDDRVSRKHLQIRYEEADGADRYVLLDMSSANGTFVNGRQITRDVRAAYSYQASNDPRVHVGLGEASQVEGVVVQWVDGTREAFGDFPADQFVTLKRGGG